MRLDALTTIGLAALALSLVRLGFIRLGVNAGVTLFGFPTPTASYLWTGLMSQAGITLGFASVVATEFPGWGSQVQLLLAASIVIHELVGPDPVSARADAGGRTRFALTRGRSSSCRTASRICTATTRTAG